MIRLVSVITPVLPAHSAWLTDTWHSLRQQEAEADHAWDWEWLVQRDGPEPLLEPRHSRAMTPSPSLSSGPKPSGLGVCAGRWTPHRLSPMQLRSGSHRSP